jgi:prepilin peptidase CpaA
MIILLGAITDIYAYIIPNKFSLLLIVSFYIFAFLSPEFTYYDMMSHTLSGLLILSVMFALFAFKIIGGGDAKLISASSLWFGFADLGIYMVSIIFFGGIVSVVFLIWRKTKPLEFYNKFTPLKRMFHGPQCQQNKPLKRRSIPYAIAIMGGFFITLPQSHIFLATFS